MLQKWLFIVINKGKLSPHKGLNKAKQLTFQPVKYLHLLQKVARERKC